MKRSHDHSSADPSRALAHFSRLGRFTCPTNGLINGLNEAYSKARTARRIVVTETELLIPWLYISRQLGRRCKALTRQQTAQSPDARSAHDGGTTGAAAATSVLLAADASGYLGHALLIDAKLARRIPVAEARQGQLLHRGSLVVRQRDVVLYDGSPGGGGGGAPRQMTDAHGRQLPGRGPEIGCNRHLLGLGFNPFIPLRLWNGVGESTCSRPVHDFFAAALYDPRTVDR